MRITTNPGQLSMVCREATITVSLLSICALGIIIMMSRSATGQQFGSYFLIAILILTLVAFFKLADWKIVIDKRKGRVDYYRKALLRPARLQRIPLTELQGIEVERFEDGTSRLAINFCAQRIVPSQVYTGNNKLQLKDMIDDFLRTEESPEDQSKLLMRSE